MLHGVYSSELRLLLVYRHLLNRCKRSPRLRASFTLLRGKVSNILSYLGARSIVTCRASLRHCFLCLQCPLALPIITSLHAD